MESTVRRRAARELGLVDELQRSHRFIIGVLLSVLALSFVTSGYLIGISQPRVTGYIDMARHARDAHDGMLDQETGLRAWLATGDSEFLHPYHLGKRNAQQAVKTLVEETKESPDVTAGVVDMLLARQRWQLWADKAVRTRLSKKQITDGTLTTFLKQGKVLFDAYRVEENQSYEQIRGRRNVAISAQNIALVTAFASYLVLLAVAGTVTVRRRRRLQATILQPIHDLRRTITQLRSGDLAARADQTAVPELDEIGAALGDLATDLTTAGADAASRERRLTTLASRFETVVRVGREIAGSLSVRYVSASVTTAAAELLGTSTVLWLRDEHQAFRAVSRSEDPHGSVPPVDLLPPSIVAQAAADAQTTTGAGATSYPLVLAGMVTAVLEVSTTTIDPDAEEVLQALLSTAAASLESAHLHSSARELADLDGLTHLPNRRRFELDVDTEWDRCRRYGRPLSLVMVDLDHFKRLNDEHGHLLGDLVLREVATAVTEALRTSDTAYRYGGEEIVVLLRETGLEDATAAAERIIAAVSGLAFPEHPQVSVTASAGVATRSTRMAHHTALVAEADAALYDAKRGGRDQVHTAGAANPALLFRGEPDAPELDDSVLSTSVGLEWSQGDSNP